MRRLGKQRSSSVQSECGTQMIGANFFEVIFLKLKTLGSIIQCIFCFHPSMDWQACLLNSLAVCLISYQYNKLANAVATSKKKHMDSLRSRKQRRDISHIYPINISLPTSKKKVHVSDNAGGCAAQVQLSDKASVCIGLETP